MKSYLLTWYGLTDLRAALGFADSGGPVLGALKTCKYTHAMILAYTDPTKAGPDAVSAQNRCIARLEDRSAARSMPSREEHFETVDALSNTPSGHERFQKWLHGEIRKLGLGVSIRIVEKDLDSLSDARGTYDAASEALDVVLATEGEKEVTVYLSPGTPVMAFTWAFVCLMNPELQIRVIASPDYRKEPEEVRLPYEILAPSSRGERVVVTGGHDEFDTVFHIFGEQRLPSLLGILQFPSRRHVFVTSAKYSADCMRRFMPAGAQFAELKVNPFDPMSAKVEILRHVASLAPGSRIGFNLTGGTKLMFAGAQAACRKIGGVPFYFETHDHSVVFLDDFTTMKLRGVDDVEQFVELGGFSVSRPGLWTDEPIRERRREFTLILWQARNRIAKLYRELSVSMGDQTKQREFSIENAHAGVSASLDGDDQGYLRIGKAEYVVERCPDFAAYLCGGWLEEYVHILLEPLKQAGRLRDLRVGLEVAWAPAHGDPSVNTAQEFDAVFTDGKRLFIIECKAGSVRNEDIYRLENSVRNYGGIQARGILVCAFPPRGAALRRLGSSKNLSYCAGRDVPSRLAREVAAMTLSGRRTS